MMQGAEGFLPGERHPGIAQAETACAKLFNAHIDFAVFGGYHAVALARHRSTSDIDILADDDNNNPQRYDELAQLFEEGTITRRPQDTGINAMFDGVNITLGNSEVNVMSGSAIQVDGTTYPFRFTDAVREHRRYTIMGFETWFADPVDTILFKAILQRGEAQGKHDIADIEHIAEADVVIDQDYLWHRIRECQAESRVRPLLQRLGVLG